MPNAPYPRALQAPSGEVVSIDADLIARAVEASRLSPRGRIILPLHLGHEDPYHRMLNAMQPGSYVRPHRHFDPPKSESAIVLRGAIGCAIFAPDGAVREALRVEAGGHRLGIDIRPGVWHTFFALEPDTVVFETKTGPYSPITDKDFAAWAPEEGAAEAAAYLSRLVALAGQN
jgi:cupin fold WbuC family metalloprotein